MWLWEAPICKWRPPCYMRFSESQHLTAHRLTMQGRRPPSSRQAPQQGRGPSERRRAGTGPVHIFGIHAVEAALGNARRTIHRLYLTDNAEHRLGAALATRQLPHERVLPKDLDRRLGPDTVHQGALAEAEPLDEPTLAELAAGAGGRPLIILDQVTDPHNVGAILRSAAVFGAGGLVMTRRHSPPLDGTLAKSASGALEYVPLALVQNLARAVAELKEVGFTVIGLDGEATETLEQGTWTGQLALVLGAEGRGLRQLTRESCDRLVRIATDGALASLNVSNAAAIALHWAAASRLGLVAGR
jgi:23S rRNA (guanosine2251-2'-O)-methyltransferase